jgi:hypothetical protein
MRVYFRSVTFVGLFESWQACLQRPGAPIAANQQSQQQQQQQPRMEFMRTVSIALIVLWRLWERVVLAMPSRVEAVVLRAAVSALKFVMHCMPQAAPDLSSGDDSNDSGSSSSSGSGSSSSANSSGSGAGSSSADPDDDWHVVEAAVLLQHIVLRTLSSLMEPTIFLNPSVEAAALQQAVASCSLLHRCVQQQPTTQQWWPQHSRRRDFGSNSSSSSSSSGWPAAPNIPTSHECLLHLLPGEQSYVEAMAAVAARATAGDAAVSKHSHLLSYIRDPFNILSTMHVARNEVAATGPLPPPLAAPGVVLQLLVERQLLAAALFHQWQQQQQGQQQQQQQQGQGQQQSSDRQRQLSKWMSHLQNSNSDLLCVQHLTGLHAGPVLAQLLSGPGALLPAALAVPLAVEGFWGMERPQDAAHAGGAGSAGEQLFALKAALAAADGVNQPGEHRQDGAVGSSPLATTTQSHIFSIELSGLLGLFLIFSILRTEEQRLRQAFLFLMRRTCNL